MADQDEKWWETTYWNQLQSSGETIAALYALYLETLNTLKALMEERDTLLEVARSQRTVSPEIPGYEQHGT